MKLEGQLNTPNFWESKRKERGRGKHFGAHWDRGVCKQAFASEYF